MNQHNQSSEPPVHSGQNVQHPGQNVKKRINTFVIDASNGKQVKSVYFIKKSKIGRDVPRMMWQYYRDRNKTDVNVVKIMFNRQKKQVHTMEIIYSGDPVIYKIPRIPIVNVNNIDQLNADQLNADQLNADQRDSIKIDQEIRLSLEE
jgi:hypothetical protein